MEQPGKQSSICGQFMSWSADDTRPQHHPPDLKQSKCGLNKFTQLNPAEPPCVDSLSFLNRRVVEFKTQNRFCST